MEIHSYAGVPLNNIVIGKPLLSSDASNGYIDPSTFGQCVSQAQSQGWNGGVMFWEWADVSGVFLVVEVVLIVE